jgi:hypothetical protein
VSSQSKSGHPERPPPLFGGGDPAEFFSGRPRSAVVSPRVKVGSAGPPKDAGVAVRRIVVRQAHHEAKEKRT